ncbi:hypothetical protein TNCV_4211591 [Trichonephila clavipes]|nr:hypothetical protein TNCV_4211591 [Trichonephila clavipes]
MQCIESDRPVDHLAELIESYCVAELIEIIRWQKHIHNEKQLPDWTDKCSPNAHKPGRFDGTSVRQADEHGAGFFWMSSLLIANFQRVSDNVDRSLASGKWS